MNKNYLLKLSTALAVIILAFSATEAQSNSDMRKAEIGAFATTIDLNKSVGERPFGVGGRFTYNFNKFIAVDSELAYYPQNSGGDFGQTQGLFGVKVGGRAEKIGVFAKVRPGFVHFGGDSFRAFNGTTKTKLATDVGGVVEFYPSKRVVVRVDAGDTIIYFGDESILSRTNTNTATVGGVTFRRLAPTTSNNFQGSIGIGFRF